MQQEGRIIGESVQDSRSNHTSSSAASNISVAESVRSKLDTNEDDVWSELKMSLTNNGISITDLATFKEDIIAYVKAKLDGEIAEAEERSRSLVHRHHPVKAKLEESVRFDFLGPGECLRMDHMALAEPESLDVRLDHSSNGWLGYYDSKAFLAVFKFSIRSPATLNKIGFQVSAAPRTDIPNGNPYVPMSRICGTDAQTHGGQGSWQVEKGSMMNCDGTVVVFVSWTKDLSHQPNEGIQRTPVCKFGFAMAMTQTVADESFEPRLFAKLRARNIFGTQRKGSWFVQLLPGDFTKELNPGDLTKLTSLDSS